MAKPSSTHIVDRFIEQRLRITEPGHALPSVRRVMDECRVGAATVSEALRSFERRNLIEVRPQRGLFRARTARRVPDIDRIDILYLNAQPDIRRMASGLEPTDGSFHGELIASLTREAQSRGLQIRFHVPAEDESDTDPAERIAADVDSRACITVGLAEVSLIRSLTAAQLSVVNLFPSSFQMPPNAITTDADEVVGQQFDHLYELGHRRIAYLHNSEAHHPHRELLLRREAFYRQAVTRGVSLLPAYVVFGGFSEGVQQQAARDVLSIPDRPTGLICADQHLPAVYAVAASFGLTIGRDLSVVGTDDKPVARAVDPPATTLQIRRTAVAQAAFDLLEKVSRGQPRPASDMMYAELKMVVRQSTGPVPSQ